MSTHTLINLRSTTVVFSLVIFQPVFHLLFLCIFTPGWLSWWECNITLRSVVFSTQFTVWTWWEPRTLTTLSAFPLMAKCAPGASTCSPSHRYIKLEWFTDTLLEIPDALSKSKAVCTFPLQDSLELVFKQSKAVAVTSMAFPLGDVNNFVVGSEDGSVYTACRHGRWVLLDLWFQEKQCWKHAFEGN